MNDITITDTFVYIVKGMAATLLLSGAIMSAFRALSVIAYF